MIQSKKKSFTIVEIMIYFSIFIVFISGLLFSLFENKILHYFSDIVEDGNIETLNAISSELTERFYSINTIIYGIHTTLDIIDDPDDATLDLYFASFHHSNIELEYVLTDLSGIVTYTYPINPIMIGNDESNTKYYLEADRSADIYWSEPYTSALDGTEIITISIKGETNYLFVNLDLSYLDIVYDQITHSNIDRELLILDAFGIILYDSLTENDDIHLPFKNYDQYTSNDTNTLFTFEYNELSYSGIKNIVEQTSWTLILYQDNQIITNHVSFIETQLILIDLSLLLIIIFMTSLGGRFYSKTLSSYFNGLKEMSSGQENVVFKRSRIRLIDKIALELTKAEKNIKVYNDTIRKIAYIDYLTKLPNRAGLKLRFNLLPQDQSYMFILLNIKRISLYNDSYGYDFGNQILIHVSDLISQNLCDDCIFGRLDGNDFLIISKISYQVLIDRIEEVFKNKFIINQLSVDIGFTYKITRYPDHGNDFEKLILNLMLVSHMKKNEHKKQIVYEESYDQSLKRQVDIELALDNSLRNNDFYPVFQPIVFKDNPKEIRGFEALARWKHDQLSQITPYEFIPILERTGMIDRLDYFIISKSVDLISSLSKKSNKKYILSCNVCVDTLLKDDFLDFIKLTLSKFDFKPNLFEIEITESTIISNPQKVTQIIKELTKIGVKFSQDDFGDGYSSLNYLTELKISTLKISKSLVDGITKGKKNKLLVSTVIDLAHNLDFQVVAEGVEEKESLDILMDLKCDLIQGYYFYKPMSFDQILELLKSI